MPSNQKKIRDIERMIKKFGSSPELLAKLEEAKHGKEDVQLKERMRKNSTKYHMVRFLERKKVTRLVRSLENKLKNDPDNTKLKKNRDKLLNDLAYIMYYPMEHKYVSLFPSKDALEKDSDDDHNDTDEQRIEKSKLLSKKAREVALQRWAEEKQKVAEGVEGAVDKVAYAMEVEYKGGAAASAGLPAKPSSAPAASSREPKQPKAAQNKGKKASTPAAANHSGEYKDDNSSDSSESSSDSSDSSSSESESDGDSDSAPAAKNPSITSNTSIKSASPVALASTNKTAAAKSSATTNATAAAAKAAESEDSDSEADDFFVEDGAEAEQGNNNNTAPKVYSDGNSFRYKNERASVHEIRFAATKRKYERHKRVFQNQNKRNKAQENKKARTG